MGSAASNEARDEVPRALGLIAGSGKLPFEIARAARARNCRAYGVGLSGVTSPDLASVVEEMLWLDRGDLGSLFSFFEGLGVRDVVLAGKIEKTTLYGSTPIELDAEAEQLLRGLADRGDASILGAVANALEARGFRLRPQAEWLPDLLPGEGQLGSVAPTAEQWRDIEYGMKVAGQLAKSDVGQCVVVKNQAILAVEAIEGTDAAIRRSGEVGGAGGCVVKRSRPDQDPRFDLPTVGPETLEAMEEAESSVLAFEAGRTLVLEAPILAEGADSLGIAIVGVHPKSGQEQSRPAQMESPE